MIYSCPGYHGSTNWDAETSVVSSLSTEFHGREKPQFTHWLSTVVVALRGNEPRKLYGKRLVCPPANVDFSQAVGSGDNDRLTPSPAWGSRHGRPPESYSWKIVSLPHCPNLLSYVSGVL